MKRRRTWPKKPSAALRHMRFNEFKPMTDQEQKKISELIEPEKIDTLKK